MARRTIITLIDDIDETEGETVETVRFSLDGSDYEIDLNEDNRIALHKVLAPYLAKARRVQVQQARRPGRAGGGASDAGLIRTWAKLNGVAVTERGRISAAVREQYRVATQVS